MSETYNVNALPSGSMLQEYRLVRVIGAGSFGIIYLAENTFLPQHFAIKEFLPSELAQRADGGRVSPKSSDAEEAYQWALEKFLKEARIIWELGQPNRHPNIVRVARFFEENGTAYMVMDFEEGESLAQRLDTGPISEDELRGLLNQLLDGLERVHERSVWHRDIKPANILIRPDGVPVLIDFGAARQEVGDHSASIMDVYTPDYAAPEQVYAQGHIGPWTDIYGLGATLYRAVMGKPPTSAPQRALGAEHVRAVDGAINDYSFTFLEAIDAAIELKPEDRPQSVEQWRQRFEGKFGLLAEVGGDETVVRPRSGAVTSASPAGAQREVPSRLEASKLASGTSLPPTSAAAPPQREDKPRGRGALTAIVSTLAVVLAGGGAAVYWMYGQSPPGKQVLAPSSVTDNSGARQAGSEGGSSAGSNAATVSSTQTPGSSDTPARPATDAAQTAGEGGGSVATPTTNAAEVTRLVNALSSRDQAPSEMPSSADGQRPSAPPRFPVTSLAEAPRERPASTPKREEQTLLQPLPDPVAESKTEPPRQPDLPERLTELRPQVPDPAKAQQLSSSAPVADGQAGIVGASPANKTPTNKSDESKLALARPAVAPNPEQIRRRALQLVAEQKCAALKVSVLEDSKLRLSGFASSRSSLDGLIEQLRRIDSVNGVESEVALYGRPFCEVLQILDADASLGSASVGSPHLEPDKASRIYLEGELLKLAAYPTKDFDGYLYVDYIDGEGNVLHLLPAPHQTQNWLVAGEMVLLGRDRQYRIAPPHGESMIIAISSRERLFDEVRPEIESAAEYLPVLRSRLRQLEQLGKAAGVTSSYTIIKTRAKNAAIQDGGQWRLARLESIQPLSGGSKVKPNSAGSSPITAAENM